MPQIEMRIQRERDDDMRELIDQAASSWSGPSPLASQSRWTARAAARQSALHVAGVTAAAACFTALVVGVSMAAAWRSPWGAADSVTHLVSHVLPGTTTTPSIPVDAASPSASSPSPGSSALRPPHVAARAAPGPLPAPWSGIRTPEPEPSDPPWPSASFLPSPGRSQPPDR